MNVPVTLPVPIRCLLALLLLTFHQCEAQLRNPQIRITGADTVGHTFLQEGPNVIENRAHLDHFFEKLYYQRVAGGRRISIVHIGDSHILGNFLTREVRARLQNAFGDAGRGLIFPYRLAGTHGPKDYLVETNVRWQGSNCNANLDNVTPYGVSGFALETYNQTGELSVRMRDTATSETRMLTKITIFSRQPESEVSFTVTDPVSNQSATQLLAGDNFRSYYFDRPVTQFTLQYKRATNSKAKKLVIDGISVENEMAGVVYHSIGVNGSRFADFARAKHFAKEVGDLMPDLIILSFGTNEGQMPVSSNGFYNQIQTLVDQLLEACPGTAVLITTPADSYLRGKGFNPNLPDVTATLRRFADNRNFAIWDLYGIGGGPQSAQTWKEKGLMASDSVHFSKIGYTAQGKLLYQAIIKGYQEYIRPVVPAETKK
jgi:lysophospholipase L1-like esterase